MSEARYLIGDVFARLADVAPGSVDLVACSPPFLAQRSYLPDDHDAKAFELGSEPGPAEFLANLLRLSELLGAVLAPHGSIAVELGDTMAGSGGAGGDYDPDGLRAGQARYSGSAAKRARNGVTDGGRPARNAPRSSRPKYDGGPLRDREAREADGIVPPRLRTRRHLPGWPLDKSLCFVPELYAASLAYGRNLLDADADPFEPWRVRQFVTWGRPNPPVGALADKYRPACSYITIASRSRHRWFDLHAVRRPASPNTNPRTAKGVDSRANDGKVPAESGRRTLAIQHAHDTAPPLDWWDDPYDDDELPDLLVQATEQYRGSHYATWPRRLAGRLIDSMCPHEVCTGCGQPRRRLLEPTPERAALLGADMFGRRHNEEMRHTAGRSRGDGKGNARVNAAYDTIGWSHCGCGDGCTPTTWTTKTVPVLDDELQPVLTRAGKPKMRKQRVVADVGACNDPTHWRRGLVLDPFAGSGTTLAVAAGTGRDAIGIDLDDRNLDLARDRIGLFLVEDRDAVWHADDCGGWPACNGCGFVAADMCWYPGPCPPEDAPHQAARSERGEVYA